MPDGIAWTKGFVKDKDEAWRFLSSQDVQSPRLAATREGSAPFEDTEKAKDRRIDLTKNVL